MRQVAALRPEFVELMPATIEPAVLYVSMEHRVTKHLCASGCGEVVVLPLHPAQWRLTFDGEHVSLEPSVGNADLACRAHYFITKNEVRWARPLSAKQGQVGRQRDVQAVISVDAVRTAKDGASGSRPWWRRLLRLR